jgi:hypothetical protein
MPTPRKLGAAGGPFQLSIREVKQLWWWQRDGAIMTPQIRGQLRRAFGLCPRHTWAHFAAECELRDRPFSTAILYRDLICWAAQSLQQAPRRRSSPPPITALQTRERCATCQWLASSTAPEDLGFAERLQRVNRLERTRGYLEECRRLWTARSCPHCLDGDGLVCRPHLLAADPTSIDEDACAAALLELGERVGTLVATMTLGGPVARAQDRAALVEALGWCTGWALVQQVARLPGPGLG